jgi:hypothetical protein
MFGALLNTLHILVISGTLGVTFVIVCVAVEGEFVLFDVPAGVKCTSGT